MKVSSIEILPSILILKTKSIEQPKMMNQNILLSTSKVYLTSILYEQMSNLNFDNISLILESKATAGKTFF